VQRGGVHEQGDALVDCRSARRDGCVTLFNAKPSLLVDGLLLVPLPLSCLLLVDPLCSFNLRTNSGAEWARRDLFLSVAVFWGAWGGLFFHAIFSAHPTLSTTERAPRRPKPLSLRPCRPPLSLDLSWTDNLVHNRPLSSASLSRDLSQNDVTMIPLHGRVAVAVQNGWVFNIVLSTACKSQPPGQTKDSPRCGCFFTPAPPA